MSNLKLRFVDLRQANMKRIPQFRNSLGNIAHPNPDGSDWSLNDWMTAVCGEVGELANELKKIRRGDCTLEEVKKKVSDEIADIAIYLDILAFQCGIELDTAVISKFNEVSLKRHCNVFLDEAGVI